MAPRRRKVIERWSMYQELHDDVDDDINCTKMRDTNIMGWSSKKIAITIRQYIGQKYNARVYHQRCKACNSLSRPILDHSYAERVTFWVKQWNGFRVEKPPVSGASKGSAQQATM
ncbi:zinc-binding domain-containing protein [Aspergillus leporis]|uniref:Zinc-binding domain-containing protein n=1 Tax=Aspergillus leporis TaxID=41062 RepID=A0A5N5WK95_9EURO|nr:zinc-binding domain-containing protein [Aspergillus leporis]